jgi:hypothetical protein
MAASPSLADCGKTPGGVERRRGLSNRPLQTDYYEAAMKDRIEELLDLIEVEPDRLRTAEFLNAQAVLERLVGKTVASANVEDTRVAITTADGARYYFYGFLGFEKPS